MQKFILTFLFLGLLVSMLYLPTPIEKIEAVLDHDEYLFLPKSTTHHSPKNQYQASSEPYKRFLPIVDEKKYKKNIKKIDRGNGFHFPP